MIAALFAGRVLLGMGRSVAEAAERAFVADLCDKVPAVRARVLAAQQAVAGAGLVLTTGFLKSALHFYGDQCAQNCLGLIQCIN